MLHKWKHWDLENGELEAWGLSAAQLACVLPPVLPHLVTLNLSHCDLPALPDCLLRAPALMNISIQGCGLESVPDWLSTIKLYTCVIEPDRVLPAPGHYQRHCGQYWDQETLMTAAREISSPGDAIGTNALRIIAAMVDHGPKIADMVDRGAKPVTVTNGVRVVDGRSCLRFRVAQRPGMNPAVNCW